MLILVRVLIGVYTIAVNIYSFLLVKQQRDSVEEGECKQAVQDGKLFITALAKILHPTPVDHPLITYPSLFKHCFCFSRQTSCYLVVTVCFYPLF